MSRYKVTCAGHPVCPPHSPHKKPFELAFIARRVVPATAPAAAACANTPTVCVCCPPSCHSRKPPLEAILPALAAELGLDAEWVQSTGSGSGMWWTELFGRECRRGGLVVGNQAVALNRRNAWLTPQ